MLKCNCFKQKVKCAITRLTHYWGEFSVHKSHSNKGPMHTSAIKLHANKNLKKVC